jgi:hypothetical protein
MTHLINDEKGNPVPFEYTSATNARFRFTRNKDGAVEYVKVNELDELMDRLPEPKKSLAVRVWEMRKMREKAVNPRQRLGEVSLQQVMDMVGLGLPATPKPSTPKGFKRRT